MFANTIRLIAEKQSFDLMFEMEGIDLSKNSFIDVQRFPNYFLTIF